MAHDFSGAHPDWHGGGGGAIGPPHQPFASMGGTLRRAGSAPVGSVAWRGSPPELGPQSPLDSQPHMVEAQPGRWRQHSLNGVHLGDEAEAAGAGWGGRPGLVTRYNSWSGEPPSQQEGCSRFGAFAPPGGGDGSGGGAGGGYTELDFGNGGGCSLTQH